VDILEYLKFPVVSGFITYYLSTVLNSLHSIHTLDRKQRLFPIIAWVGSEQVTVMSQTKQTGFDYEPPKPFITYYLSTVLNSLHSIHTLDRKL
jgi:hypothetical protein